MAPFLFILTTVIWGSGWYAIKFQNDGSTIAVALGWRFLIASLLLLGWCAVRKISLRITAAPLRDIVFMGLANFGINFWMFYKALTLIPSGLVAMAFSALVIYNMIGGVLFLRLEMPRNAWLGAGMGVAGLAIFYWRELGTVYLDGATLSGILLALAGNLSASVGNLMIVKIQKRQVAILPALTLGMMVGAISMFALALIEQDDLRIPLTAPFLTSLGYLSIFGSVIAFVAYSALIDRVGPVRASYCGMIIPLFGLAISMALEGLPWRSSSIIGVMLILSGHLLIHRFTNRPPRGEAALSPLKQ